MNDDIGLQYKPIQANYLHFYKAYYAVMKEYFLEYFEGNIALTQDNYWATVLRPAVVGEELDRIEQRHQILIPQNFRDFLWYLPDA